MDTKWMKLDHITPGVCYYPEHWGRAYWCEDLDKMAELGIEAVRVGEFAWNFFEPEEGRYEFDFFDAFLNEAQVRGIQIILCTPTCTPPSWLSKKYPETLNATMEGSLYRHGMRQHHNMTNSFYLEKCDKLVSAMAEHYGSHPAVIGWQLDNEINCEIASYYALSDREAFRGRLKEKYGTLDALNQAMGADFWNQSYSSWDEVDLPGLTPRYSPNPHLVLEEKRFISHTAISYLKRQADSIRKYVGQNCFITTNGIFKNLDYEQLLSGTSLDFITYDSYPNFAFAEGTNPRAKGALNDRNTSYNLAKVRAISPIFGIMEQQAGGGGWNTRLMQPAPKPGQLRLWSFQSIAHGSDFISYFRFRTSDVGTEMYWTGLYDGDNRENRRVMEAKDTITDMKKIAEVAGAKCVCGVGILENYDSTWDAENDIFLKPLDQISLDGWFRSLQKHHIPFDFVDFRDGTAAEKLSRYGILAAPHLSVLTEAQALLLENYVTAGGTLIMGARSGAKDKNGHMNRHSAPGLLRKLTGCMVEEYTVLGPGDVGADEICWKEEPELRTHGGHLQEVLCPEKAETLAVYGGNYYKGAPAFVRNLWGNGTVYYLGTSFCEDTVDRILKLVSVEATNWLDMPKELELTIRANDTQAYYFVLNYQPYEVGMMLAEPALDLLSGTEYKGKATIPSYGVMVLRKEKKQVISEKSQ